MKMGSATENSAAHFDDSCRGALDINRERFIDGVLTPVEK
jgi:hypothetical protein